LKRFARTNNGAWSVAVSRRINAAGIKSHAATTGRGTVRFVLRKQQRIEDLEASVAYFSSANKPERERHTVSDFIQNLALAFRKSELRSVPSHQEPTDVTFRKAAFEIKEILDMDRLRHAEYKARLEEARNARTYKQLHPLSRFTPRDITITELLHETEKASAALLGKKYPLATTEKLDLLIYFNKIEVWGLVEEGFPNSAVRLLAGWRSVSVVMGHRAIVFLATPSAPRFLRRVVGRICHRPAA
jgi:hypothetical protein